MINVTQGPEDVARDYSKSKTNIESVPVLALSTRDDQHYKYVQASPILQDAQLTVGNISGGVPRYASAPRVLERARLANQEANSAAYDI